MMTHLFQFFAFPLHCSTLCRYNLVAKDPVVVWENKYNQQRCRC